MRHETNKLSNGIMTGIVLLLVGNVTGCVRLGHYLHWHTPAKQLQEGHIPYFHCPDCGMLVPKHLRHKCGEPGGLPYYGYRDTCWRAWPAEWMPCAPPERFESGNVLEMHPEMLPDGRFVEPLPASPSPSDQSYEYDSAASLAIQPSPTVMTDGMIEWPGNGAGTREMPREGQPVDDLPAELRPPELEPEKIVSDHPLALPSENQSSGALHPEFGPSLTATSDPATPQPANDNVPSPLLSRQELPATQPEPETVARQDLPTRLESPQPPSTRPSMIPVPPKSVAIPAPSVVASQEPTRATPDVVSSTGSSEQPTGEGTPGEASTVQPNPTATMPSTTSIASQDEPRTPATGMPETRTVPPHRRSAHVRARAAIVVPVTPVTPKVASRHPISQPSAGRESPVSEPLASVATRRPMERKLPAPGRTTTSSDGSSAGKLRTTVIHARKTTAQFQSEPMPGNNTPPATSSVPAENTPSTGGSLRWQTDSASSGSVETLSPLGQPLRWTDAVPAPASSPSSRPVPNVRARIASRIDTARVQVVEFAPGKANRDRAPADPQDARGRVGAHISRDEE